MGLQLSDLITPMTKEAARAQLLTAAQGLGFPQNDGDGDGVVALSGTPNGSYDIRLQVLTVTSGVVLTFRYSLDGATTWSTSVSPTAGVFVLPGTGVSVTFTAPETDSFNPGDTYTVATFSPPMAVTSWGPFAVPRLLLEVVAVAISFFSNLIAKVASGGLIDYARGSWLTITADQEYDTQRFDGVPTKGFVTLTDVASSGPWPITTGVTLFQTAGGLRYRAAQDATLPLGGTVSVLVQAEAIGHDYNVGAAAIVVLGTPLPGVTVTNGSSWITQQGTDDESDPELKSRAKSRWASLAPALTNDGWAYYAKTANQAVSRVKARVSPTVPGQTDLILAGQAGPVSGPVVTSVQAALSPLAPLTTTINAMAATPHTDTVTGTVYYYAAFAASITNDILDALVEFYATVDIGGTRYASRLEAALQDVAGVRNLAFSMADLVLGDTEVAAFVNSLTLTAV